MKTIVINILLVSSLLMMSGCGESNNARSSSYQDLPTYQQWQNVEAFNCLLIILGTIMSSSDTNNCFGNPYRWEDRQMYGGYGYYEPWMR